MKDGANYRGHKPMKDGANYRDRKPVKDGANYRDRKPVKDGANARQQTRPVSTKMTNAGRAVLRGSVVPRGHFASRGMHAPQRDVNCN